MKIMFVQPQSTGLPHLGIMYLSAALKQAGYNDVIFCAIQDEPLSERRSYEHYLKILKEQKPDVVGVTSETPTWSDAVKFCKDAKDAGAFVIAGGPGPSCLPDKILPRYDFIDMVVYGEADNIIVDIVKRIENHDTFTGIPGVIYRESGKIVNNGRAPTITDVDALPYPDRDILDMPTYHTPFTIFSSRGCPYGCTFCFKPVFGKLWRERSVNNVVDEIEMLLNRYPEAAEKVGRLVNFSDDIFNLNISRSKAIADEIIARDLNIKLTYVNGLHVRMVDEELMHKLKRAGTVEAWFGVDAGASDTLRLLGKGITHDMVRNAVACAKKAKIDRIGAHFILGLPGETMETAKTALEFAKSLDIDVVGFNHANTLPGTYLWDWVQKHGKLLHERKDELDFSNYRHLDSVPIFETPEFTKEQREQIYADCIAYADSLQRKKAFKMARIKNVLSTVRSPEDFIWLMKAAYAFFTTKEMAKRWKKPLKIKPYKYNNQVVGISCAV